MATKNLHMDNIHFDHLLWTAKLNLFEDELKIYKNRLAEISSKNTAPVIKEKIEQFQNKFIIQQNEYEKLGKMIREQEHNLFIVAKNNPVANDRIIFDNHQEQEDQINTFEKLFQELKESFKKFCSETL